MNTTVHLAQSALRPPASLNDLSQRHFALRGNGLQPRRQYSHLFPRLHPATRRHAWRQATGTRIRRIRWARWPRRRWCAAVPASTTSATTATSLGTCTLAGGLLHTGDRIEIRFQYTHAGTTTGFTPSVTWGATTALTRTAAATETGVSARLSFSIGTVTQSFGAQSWGNTLAFATTVGGAAENTTTNLTISFKAALASSTSDTIVLSNFTVTRYPAQANP